MANIDIDLAQFFKGGVNPNNPAPMQRGQVGMLSGQSTPMDKIRIAMSKLDQNNVEDLAKLAKYLQATGDTAGAVKMLKRIDDIKRAEATATEEQAESEQETKIRDILLGIANAQGNTDVIKFLQAGGDLSKAQDVLFRAKPKAPQEPRTPHASITKTEQDIYKALFKQDDKFEDYFDEDSWLGKDDKNKILILMNKAEEIYTADPKKGRKKAADEALTMLKYGTSSLSSTSKKANNNDPFGDA